MASSLNDFLFGYDRTSIPTERAAAVAKRTTLVSQFPVGGWSTLPLERYALGTPKFRDSFCYQMEYASYELGSIAGGSADKHLIYWRSKTNAWKFESRYANAEQAWEAIRAAFVEALRLGAEGKFSEIDDLPALVAARVLRAKFISLYFPEKILPIFSEEHLLHHLRELGSDVPEEDSGKAVTLGLKLLQRLQEITELKGWTNDELMRLLYQWNPPPSKEKLLKIAPGEDAEYWESDCLPKGIICVGWDEVGDLRAFPDFESFRTEFGRHFPYNGNESAVTRKAKEVWALRDLEAGDSIAANRGIDEILAVGQVVEPGYVWDPSRPRFRHTVKVKWNTNRSGTISPVKKWATATVANVSGELQRTIRRLIRAAPTPTPQPDNIEPQTLLPGNSMHAKNLILYGPPGTGKTRHLQQLHANYTEMPKAQDREAWLEAIVADFTWREVIAVALSKLGPTNVPTIREHELVIAKARERQAMKNLPSQVWGVLQRHTPRSVTTVEFSNRTAPFIFTKEAEPIWSLLPDWKANDEEAARLAKTYDDGQKSTPAIKRFRQVTFHPSFSYEDFVRGIRPVATEEDGRTEFRLVDGVFKQICDEARANPTKRYALFIDEINRGNIAKIFGELITLIEPDKRIIVAADGTVTGGMTVQLPGSNTGDVAEPPFGVPANLDLYGTMNTADRSIALLDIALRRRFEFVEIPPCYDATVFPAPVAGVDRGKLLERINDRLEYLLDRDHRIGHAYLMKAQSLADLRSAFANQIIPLLQEYFFDDLGKVALVLAGPNDGSQFVEKKELRHADLFPGSTSRSTAATRYRYEVTQPSTWIAEHFQGIYAAAPAIEGNDDEAAS
jgi:5-methylcytosine-specific restriction protein B